MMAILEQGLATLWMIRTPVALCALIFGGMAAVNEVDSWHERAAAANAAAKDCAAHGGDRAQASEEEAGKAPSC